MTARFVSKVESWFFALLSLGLVSCVVEDLMGGIWNVHTGASYPWRHPKMFPLFSPEILILIWVFYVLSAFLIATGRRRRLGFGLAVFALLLNLTQEFSNHRSLYFIILSYLLFCRRENAFRMIRYQVCIVYLFSALNKFDAGFLNGGALAALAHNVHPDVKVVLPFVALSWIVVAFELMIPILLMWKPMFGLASIIIFHSGMSLMMPGIWPFTILMIAIATIFIIADAPPLQEDRRAV